MDEPGTTTGTAEGQAMIDLLWNPPPPPTRGPKQRLSLDQVVAGAMAVADTLGIDEVSVRRVAQRLGVGAMSLYASVPGRDELFELMLGRAWAGRGLPDHDRPWRGHVEFHAREAWRMYQQHPWLVRADLWRMPLGTHVLDAQEDHYRTVALTGLDEATVSRVADLVESHVVGAARAAVTDTGVSARTGVSADEYGEPRAGFCRTYHTPERFPTVTRLGDMGGFDGVHTDATREFGLALILDGVERLAGDGP